MKEHLRETESNAFIPGTVNRVWLAVEFSVVMLLFVIVSLNLAYQSIGLITMLGILLLLLFRAYIRWRYHIQVPLLILFFILASIEIDAVGNYLRLYQQLPWPVQYDEFAHFTIPALMAPGIVWLICALIERFGYRLPLGAVTFFSVITNFCLSGLYEIVELWDELYFGGRRIWSAHDTPRDLQWGLLGAILGSVLTYLALSIIRHTSWHWSHHIPSPQLSDLRPRHHHS